MPDQPPATGDPTPGGATPPPADPPATPPPATGGGDYPEGLGDAGKRALDAERAARREAERQATETAAELKRIKDAQLTDAERREAKAKELEADNARLTSELQRSRLEAAATAEARKQGFWDPELAFPLLDQGAVQFDDKGSPKNLETLVKALATAKPRLVNGAGGAPDFGGGHRGGAAAGAGDDMNRRIREAAGRA